MTKRTSKACVKSADIGRSGNRPARPQRMSMDVWRDVQWAGSEPRGYRSDFSAVVQ